MDCIAGGILSEPSLEERGKQWKADVADTLVVAFAIVLTVAVATAFADAIDAAADAIAAAVAEDVVVAVPIAVTTNLTKKDVACAQHPMKY